MVRLRLPTPGPCPRCGTYRRTLHMDHILPRALGGSNDASNLQLLCANCHEDKTFAEAAAIANDPQVRARRDQVRRTPEYRETARQRSLGVHPSAETRARMRDAQLGRVQSPEHRARISAALTGHKQSPEHRAKLTLSRRMRAAQRVLLLTTKAGG